jgi:polar amino acid transport system substrate-binding protein
MGAQARRPDPTVARRTERWRWAVVVVVLAVGLAACGGDNGGGGSGDNGAAATGSTQRCPNATETVSGFRPLRADTLTVGTELPAPPFWIGDDYDSITGGFEVDLAKELCGRLGLSRIRFVNMPFSGLVGGQRCPCDVAFSQVTITEERAKVVSFTVPYFDADQGVLVNEGTEVPDLEAAKALRWGAQANTTGFDEVRKLTGRDPAGVYDTVTDAFNALRARQIDAVMLDVPIVAGEAAKAGSGFEVVGRFPTGEQYGGVVEKDSPNLAVIDRVLEQLKSEGYLEQLKQKYFPAAADVPVIQ